MHELKTEAVIQLLPIKSERCCNPDEQRAGAGEPGR